MVDEAYERFRSNRDGEPSNVYPALARVPPDLFGVCVVNVAGASTDAGDVDVDFTVMSVAKPFVFALVAEAIGVGEIGCLIGVNATGLAFNSLSAVEQRGDGRTNPMVNPGPMATTSPAPGRTSEARWQFLLEGRHASPGAG